MAEPSVPPSDSAVEQLIGNLLRAGVLLAAAVVLLGGVIYLIHHGSELADHRVFRGEPADLRSPRGIVQDAMEMRGRGLIQLGLLLLIATPIARVLALAVVFVWRRDWIFIGVTLIVLAVLFYSLFSGLAEGGPNP